MKGNFFSDRKNFSTHALVLVLTVISMVLLIAPMTEGAETGDVCIDHYEPGAVCRANDVRVVSFNPVPGTFSGCTNGIATATFDVKVSALGSPDRYDIGLFFSQDGSSAKTGTSCFHDFLSGNLSATRPTIDTDADSFPDSTGSVINPYWNGDGDVCGDLPRDTNAYRTVALTFECADLNNDGFIDIPVCSSWSNKASNNCTDVTGAVPNTKSKCNCAVVPTGLTIASPAITVIKSPANQAVLSGQNATFTIDVINSGPEVFPLHNIIVTDPPCDSLTGPVGDTNSNSILETTETWTYTCTVNGVTTPFQNNVQVTGTPPSGPDVTDSATANVTVDTPLITAVKSPSTQTVVSGGTATFTITVTNPGSVTLGNIQVVDPQCTTLTGPVGDTNSNSVLETTETWAYSCMTTNVTVGFVNDVTVSGTVSGGPTVSDSASAQVSVTPAPAPKIGVIKTPSNQTVVSGGTATFGITVTNTGNVSLHSIIVSDPQCSTLTGPVGDTNSNNILETTETWAYICTVNNVTSSFANNVTVTGTPPSGPTVSDSASAQVTVTSVDTPLITTIKSPSTQTVHSGDTATFTITVTNTGDVSLHSIIVSDPQCSTLTGPVGDTNSNSILETTETWTYTCTVTNVTSSFSNDETVTGTAPDGSNVSGSGLAQVIVLPPTGGVPVAQQVPTMTEWGMIFFMLFAGAGSVYYLRRKRIG